ncbi:MAG TPA: hypothetical protein VK927_02040 [Adhaeribacter sp.]|nr:hypothetical protein [Adhaeribacter sp.]
MKKIWTLVLSMLIVLIAMGDATAQQRSLFGPKKPIPNTRGKANIRDLAKEIHETLQNGNDYRLISFLPNDIELKKLRKASSAEELNQILDATNARQLEGRWKEDVAVVQSQLRSDSLNIAKSTVVSVAGGRGNRNLPGVIPVTITLADANQKPVEVTFQALRLDKRLFLFRNLEVKKEMQAVNMERANP